MFSSARSVWIRPVLVVGGIYAVVGIVTADLAGAASSLRSVAGWRWTAWLVSLIVFAGHIAYEQIRLRHSVRNAAAHVATAVAVGTFVLALVGPVRSHWGMADFWRAAVLSLPLWPILAGVPAFIVALVAGSILGRLVRRDRSASAKHVA